MLEQNQIIRYLENISEPVQQQAFFIALTGNDEDREFLSRQILEFDKMLKWN